MILAAAAKLADAALSVAASAIKSKVLWGLIALGALFWGVGHIKASAYADGLRDGRAECHSNTLQAQLDALRISHAGDAEALRKESERARKAEELAEKQKTQIAKVTLAVRAQPNAQAMCLSKETTDALRALR